jgi:hypothetical protein
MRFGRSVGGASSGVMDFGPRMDRTRSGGHPAVPPSDPFGDTERFRAMRRALEEASAPRGELPTRRERRHAASWRQRLSLWRAWRHH